MYTTAIQTVQSVDESPGWVLLGSYVPRHGIYGHLDVIAEMSGPDLTGRVKVCRMSGANLIDLAMVEFSQQSTTRMLSEEFLVASGTMHQFFAECTGSASEGEFMIVHGATVVAQ